YCLIYLKFSFWCLLRLMGNAMNPNSTWLGSSTAALLQPALSTSTPQAQRFAVDDLIAAFLFWVKVDAARPHRQAHDHSALTIPRSESRCPRDTLCRS
ncbi:MAG: hypothetical protein QM756_06265, partial [Polyangiaceae bacterium]